MSNLEKLKIKLELTDDSKDELLSVLLSDAKDTVLDLIGRDIVPPRLQSVVVELAKIAYNRMGAEGESSRSEGGASFSFIDDLPEPYRSRLKNYPRKVGVIK